jgi:hypothetical protein
LDFFAKKPNIHYSLSMKKTLSSLLFVIFTFSLLMPRHAQAQIPAKPKAFLTIVGYGTAGGAILGAASMAFGTSSRAIAQGASLGLYAGILFGTYVLVSHHQKRTGSYDDNSSPYQESNDIYGDDYQNDDGGSSDSGNKKSGFFDRYENPFDRNKTLSYSLNNKKGGGLPPLYLNIIQYNF